MKKADLSQWIETQATVVSCQYQFARMNTLTLGVQTGDKFRIAFDYYAHGQLYTGEFESHKAVPQGETIPIRYNALRPQQNSYSDAGVSGSSRVLIFAGVAASVILSLTWALSLRGCS